MRARTSSSNGTNTGKQLGVSNKICLTSVGGFSVGDLVDKQSALGGIWMTGLRCSKIPQHHGCSEHGDSIEASHATEM